jgi:hypothetical protein
MIDSAVAKVVEEGRVYARRSFEDGHVVIEKIDPRITHDAPASVVAGSELTITFAMVDFDDSARTDSGGVLLLEVDETEVPLAITNGSASFVIELFASAKVRQQPPYFCDARMEPFEIEVTA